MNNNSSSQKQQNLKRIMNKFSADVIQKAISFQNRNQSTKKLHPKCKFSEEEDDLLRNLVSEMLKSNEKNVEYDDENSSNAAIATIDWNKIALSMKTTRNARQCRERYLNYLSPLVENGPWTKEEEDLLCEKYNEIGPHWKQISSFFPSRTDINVKSHFHLIERRNRKAEKNRLKSIQKQEEIESINKVNQPNIISNYQPNHPIVNNSISNSLNYQTSQNVINNSISNNLNYQSNQNIVNNSISNNLNYQSNQNIVNNSISNNLNYQTNQSVVNNSISNGLNYQINQTVVNNSISSGLNYQSNQPVVNNTISSLPLPFAPAPNFFYSNKAPQIKEPVNQQQQKNNSEQNTANGEENICESPLPFFSLLAQEAEKEFESNSNECWNSLLMNEEANETEMFLDKWF